MEKPFLFLTKSESVSRMSVPESDTPTPTAWLEFKAKEVLVMSIVPATFRIRPVVSSLL